MVIGPPIVGTLLVENIFGLSSIFKVNFLLIILLFINDVKVNLG